ncbi:dATP/dGTP pyrophosphohydrolase domain-containing protein [Paracoccus sp. KR1-242]|uniref:dATP/dGTP pyrophosphohydrolase domain-containing protein n=1 Tax=Paracoccus sp. KR1-242 TaxID=3410028 RepID=UPI003C01DE2F
MNPVSTPPAADLAQLRAEHAAWSQAQFGDVSAVGPAKHLSKEALEVVAAPCDPIEHADCWMLLWDMQRRAGISDEQLTQAIREKLAVNKARAWPAPKEGEAREHQRGELPAGEVTVADAAGILLTDRSAVLMLAQAYDREDSAQRGEPDPHGHEFQDEEHFKEWQSERIACSEAALIALGGQGR